jgi:Rrf2 family cysteine metabolism transcriptional repressor
MRVSAKAEYACVAMLELAAGHGVRPPMHVKAIAQAQGVPQRFLVQILLHLKVAGLVVSTRGAGGGYELARPPAEISLADIINVIDRPDRPRPDSLPESRAAQALQEVWREIRAEQQRRLAEVTLADLVRRTHTAHTLTYQI